MNTDQKQTLTFLTLVVAILTLVGSFLVPNVRYFFGLDRKEDGLFSKGGSVQTIATQSSAPPEDSPRHQPAATSIENGEATPPVIGYYPATEGFITFSPSEVHVGEPVTFTVHPQGGTGHYKYDWYGTVTGHTPSIIQVYDTPGEKDVSVIIYSYGSPTVAVKKMNVRQ